MTKLTEESRTALCISKDFGARMLDLLVAMTELGHRPSSIVPHAELKARPPIPGKRSLGGVEWRFEDGTRVLWRRVNRRKLAWSYMGPAVDGEEKTMGLPLVEGLREIAKLVPAHLLKSETWREPPTAKTVAEARRQMTQAIESEVLLGTVVGEESAP